MPINRRDSSADGFTLLEMLLGILIFSVIALSLYSTFAAGLHLNRRGEQALKIQREARWTLDQMARDLENMVYYDFSGSYPALKSFTATPGSMAFLKVTGKGLMAVRYRLQPIEYGSVHATRMGIRTDHNVTVVTGNTSLAESPRMALQREVQDFRSFLTQGFTGASREILSRAVVSDGFKIFYAATPKNNAASMSWVDSWDETATPRGVRLALTLAAGDRDEKAVFVRDVFIPTGILHEE